MFSLLKLWATCPNMLSVSLIRCKHEALKKLHLKSTIKCFKKAKICKWPEIDSFLPIDCCVRINGEPDRLFSGDIFSHTFLDSDCINFKTFAFLAVYWPFCMNNHFLNWSLTMLNNVFRHCQSISFHSFFPPALVPLFFPSFQVTMI